MDSQPYRDHGNMLTAESQGNRSKSLEIER
jgi:hypothetical protein